MEEANRYGEERFGTENWEKVQLLLGALESYQIYYLDPSPANIIFTLSDDEEE